MINESSCLSENYSRLKEDGYFISNSIFKTFISIFVKCLLFCVYLVIYVLIINKNTFFLHVLKKKPITSLNMVLYETNNLIHKKKQKYSINLTEILRNLFLTTDLFPIFFLKFLNSIFLTQFFKHFQNYHYSYYCVTNLEYVLMFISQL